MKTIIEHDEYTQLYNSVFQLHITYMFSSVAVWPGCSLIGKLIWIEGKDTFFGVEPFLAGGQHFL